MSHEVLQQAIRRLADHKDLTSEEAAGAFEALLDGEASDIEIAAFLMGLRVKGETLVEIEAGARAMRARARRIDVGPDIVDTCGTGGLPRATLNTSSAAAIVVAACGGRVAKHGNRSAPPKTGSADVLEKLGVKLDIDEATFKACLDKAGVAFMFAQTHHSAMRHVAPTRKALGIKTIFNLLGPLTNPAGAKRQVLGVYDKAWLEPIAKTLANLGSEHALVVHSADGLDEISVSDITYVAEVKDGVVSTFELSPERFDINRWPTSDINGGSIDDNAQAIRDIFNGTENAFSDIVALNAGAALFVGGWKSSIADGYEAALNALSSGAAAKTLKVLVQTSNETT